MRDQTERYCAACGEVLPPGSHRYTCNQTCRTRLARRKKAIRKLAAVARCNIYAVLGESQIGPHRGIALDELIEIEQYARTAVRAYEQNEDLPMPIADYNRVLGYVPDSVEGVKP